MPGGPYPRFAGIGWHKWLISIRSSGRKKSTLIDVSNSSKADEKGFFTDLSTAPEAAESARDRGQSELVAPWPTSVSAAASVHRACLARGEGRP